MAKAYISDLRLRSLKLIEQGKLQTEVSDLMGVTVQTLCKWWRLYRLSGVNDAKKPNFIRKRKVDYQKVKNFVINHPDKTLFEIGDHFGLSDVGALKIIKKLGITYKKTLPLRGKTGRFERRISKTIESNS